MFTHTRKGFFSNPGINLGGSTMKICSDESEFQLTDPEPLHQDISAELMMLEACRACCKKRAHAKITTTINEPIP